MHRGKRVLQASMAQRGTKTDRTRARRGNKGRDKNEAATERQGGAGMTRQTEEETNVTDTEETGRKEEKGEGRCKGKSRRKRKAAETEAELGRRARGTKHRDTGARRRALRERNGGRDGGRCRGRDRDTKDTDTDTDDTRAGMPTSIHK